MSTSAAPPLGRRSLRPIGPAAVLTLALLVAFGGLVARPRSLIVDAERPWIDEGAGPSARPIGNDLTGLFLPRFLWQSEHWRRSRLIPRWDPRGFAGRPNVGNPQAGPWYPPLWVAWSWGDPAALGWLTVAHLLWLGLGAAALARALGLGRAAATGSGAVLMLNPYVLAQIHEGHLPHAWSASWYPWAFLGALLLRRGRPTGWLLLPPSLACSLMTGHPQEGAYLALALLAWAAFDAASALRRPLPPSTPALPDDDPPSSPPAPGWPPIAPPEPGTSRATRILRGWLEGCRSARRGTADPGSPENDSRGRPSHTKSKPSTRFGIAQRWGAWARAQRAPSSPGQGSRDARRRAPRPGTAPAPGERWGGWGRAQRAPSSPGQGPGPGVGDSRPEPNGPGIGPPPCVPVPPVRDFRAPLPTAPARRPLAWAAAFALAAGLSAVEWLPMLRVRPWVAGPLGGGGGGGSGPYHLHPSNLWQLVSPRALGGPADFLGRGNHWETLLSVGWAPLVLVVVGVASSPHRRAVRAWSSLLAASLAMAAGPPLGLSRLVAALPGLEAARVPARALFLAALAASLLAGLGVDALARPADRASARRAARRYALAVSLIVLALAAGLLAESRTTASPADPSTIAPASRWPLACGRIARDGLTLAALAATGAVLLARAARPGRGARSTRPGQGACPGPSGPSRRALPALADLAESHRRLSRLGPTAGCSWRLARRCSGIRRSLSAIVGCPSRLARSILGTLTPKCLDHLTFGVAGVERSEPPVPQPPNRSESPVPQPSICPNDLTDGVAGVERSEPPAQGPRTGGSLRSTPATPDRKGDGSSRFGILRRLRRLARRCSEPHRALAAVAVAELALSAALALPLSPASRFLAPDAVSEALDRHRPPGPFRLRARDAFYPDLFAWRDGVEKTNLNDLFQLRHAAEIYRALYPLFDAPRPPAARPLDPALARAALDRLGVALVLADRPVLLHVGPVVASGVRDGTPFSLLANPTALPRAYVVPAAEVVPPSETLARLPATDPRSAVLLPTDPLPGLDGPRQPFTPAVVRAISPDRLLVRVTTDAPGLLVLADAWMPGWSAAVNGRPAPLLRGDHAVRVVPLPDPGPIEVLLTYRAPGLSLGALLSAASAALVLLLASPILRRAPAPDPPAV